MLDATKHQDDKVGRLLAAVAFLTGALVLSDVSVLRATYELGDSEFRLPALLIGSFLILDLVAVMIWVLTLATPLRPPGQSDRSKQLDAERSSFQKSSYLFFLQIGRLSLSDWRSQWPAAPQIHSLRAHVTQDLISETHNLATRALQKYEQSRQAARVFLASLALLAPGLVGS
ncbi:MAG: hypothetical protein ACT4OM_06120 [Actinomycetota bacterium]